MSGLLVTLFADFTSPYSYVTEAGLWRFAQRHGATIVYRAYELYPAPATPPPEEEGWHDRVAPLAQELGLALGEPAFRPRTRKAHEAARFAAEHGVEQAYRAAVYSAYWREGQDVGRIDVLTGLVGPLGVDPEEMKIALDIDRYSDAVLRDQATAARLHLPGVPTLFVGSGPGARVLVGAQPSAALDEALTRG